VLARPDDAISVFLLEEERVGDSAGFKPNLEFARALEFDWFCGGHGNTGEKSDFDFYLSYLTEVETRSRLLSELDNHFSLYLYGRQIVAGEQPGRVAGGPNPFMAGLIGEWAAKRHKAIEAAVPRILERLRPSYGRMYNFDDAQPGNIRLLALSMQPSLTNR